MQTLLKSLTKSTVEQILEAEMDDHLGYDKHSPSGNNSGNSRNGYSKKTIKSFHGETEILVPRDRNSDFHPHVIEKRQTRSNDLEGRILAMYAKGMSSRDIEGHLRDVHGVDAYPSLISRIADKILPAVSGWQIRTLDRIYPFVFFDGIVFKVRKDNRAVYNCLYSVLGINMDGRKEILGIWLSENERASFWATVCSDLKNRGVEDILIACRDNLSGFPNAVEIVYPKTERQLCVIHQIRSSANYVSYKDLKEVMADLKRVYGALTGENAEYALLELEEKWGIKYPQIVKSWRTNWAEMTTYFEYLEEVGRLIYTAKAVEGFHRMLRKYTKTKTVYRTDDAVNKSVYLSILHIPRDIPFLEICIAASSIPEQTEIVRILDACFAKEHKAKELFSVLDIST